MSGRDWGDVPSYPVQSGYSADDRGYVLTIDGNGRVGKVAAGEATASNLFGANYKSTEDQDGNVETLEADDQTSVVRHSAGFPLRAAARSWTAGELAQISAGTDGVVDAATGNATVGVVVETVDLSGEAADGDGEVLVSFDFAHTGE